MTTLPQLIKTHRERYNKPPEDINNGQCEEFMQAITNDHPKAIECCTGLVLDNTGFTYPIHVWVYANGKHYDAECPTGVPNFQDLPFWQNHSATITPSDIRDNKFTR